MNVVMCKEIISNSIHFRPKKRKHKHHDKERSDKNRTVVDDDALQHGGWWKTSEFGQIVGTVAIEFGKNAYIKSLDDGTFTLGAPHDDGDGPAPEEILTALQINDRHLAFKSGYGKYLKVEKDGVITGRSEAVGGMEQFEPIFQVGHGIVCDFALMRYVSFGCKRFIMFAGRENGTFGGEYLLFGRRSGRRCCCCTTKVCRR